MCLTTKSSSVTWRRRTSRCSTSRWEMMGGIAQLKSVLLPFRFSFHIKYVMYVPGLKKNMVSVSILEDSGYNVIFSKGKAFLHHIASG